MTYRDLRNRLDDADDCVKTLTKLASRNTDNPHWSQYERADASESVKQCEKLKALLDEIRRHFDES